MDAKTMAQAIRPPVVMLPRFSWVPFIGAWLGRKLPAKAYTGRVMSYMEFLPWQQKMAKAQDTICLGCRKTLKKAPESPEGVDGPEWFGCVCEGEPEPGKHYTEEEWIEVCVGFVKANGLPGSIFLLPGTVLLEVMQELFLFQTGANSPRIVREKLMAQMSGNNSQSKAGDRQSGRKSQRAGS